MGIHGVADVVVDAKRPPVAPEAELPLCPSEPPSLRWALATTLPCHVPMNVAVGGLPALD
jgi:hypothetical protein